MAEATEAVYAYIAEVRESLDTPWRPHTLLVTYPGKAPRDLLDVVEEGMEHLIRCKRITDSGAFVDYIGLNMEGGLPLLMDENFTGQEDIEFKS